MFLEKSKIYFAIYIYNKHFNFLKYNNHFSKSRSKQQENKMVKIDSKGNIITKKTVTKRPGKIPQEKKDVEEEVKKYIGAPTGAKVKSKAVLSREEKREKLKNIHEKTMKLLQEKHDDYYNFMKSVKKVTRKQKKIDEALESYKETNDLKKLKDDLRKLGALNNKKYREIVKNEELVKKYRNKEISLEELVKRSDEDLLSREGIVQAAQIGKIRTELDRIRERANKESANKESTKTPSVPKEIEKTEKDVKKLIQEIHDYVKPHKENIIVKSGKAIGTALIFKRAIEELAKIDKYIQKLNFPQEKRDEMTEIIRKEQEDIKEYFNRQINANEEITVDNEDKEIHKFTGIVQDIEDTIIDVENALENYDKISTIEKLRDKLMNIVKDTERNEITSVALDKGKSALDEVNQIIEIRKRIITHIKNMIEGNKLHDKDPKEIAQIIAADTGDIEGIEQYIRLILNEEKDIDRGVAKEILENILIDHDMKIEFIRNVDPNNDEDVARVKEMQAEFKKRIDRAVETLNDLDYKNKEKDIEELGKKARVIDQYANNLFKKIEDIDNSAKPLQEEQPEQPGLLLAKGKEKVTDDTVAEDIKIQIITGIKMSIDNINLELDNINDEFNSISENLVNSLNSDDFLSASAMIEKLNGPIADAKKLFENVQKAIEKVDMQDRSDDPEVRKELDKLISKLNSVLNFIEVLEKEKQENTDYIKAKKLIIVNDENVDSMKENLDGEVNTKDKNEVTGRKNVYRFIIDIYDETISQLQDLDYDEKDEDISWLKDDRDEYKDQLKAFTDSTMTGSGLFEDEESRKTTLAAAKMFEHAMDIAESGNKQVAYNIIRYIDPNDYTQEVYLSVYNYISQFS